MKTVKSPRVHDLTSKLGQLGKRQENKGGKDQNQGGTRQSDIKISRGILSESGIVQNKQICGQLLKGQLIYGQKTPIQREFDSRRKSYANLDVSSISKQSRKQSPKIRDEHKSIKDSVMLSQIIPTYAYTPIESFDFNTNNNFQSRFSYNKQKQTSVSVDVKKQKDFLNNMQDYMMQLGKQSRQMNREDRMSETFKIAANSYSSLKLVSKLEQSQIKIKELKLKVYYQERQLLKRGKRQQKIKDNLYDMLGEVRELTAQLSRERRQRKKLQRIMDSFQMGVGKPERRTMGNRSTVKREYKIQQDQSDINLWVGDEGKAVRRGEKEHLRISLQNFRNGKRGGIKKMLNSSQRASQSDNE